jgi:threonine dehydratase
MDLTTLDDVRAAQDRIAGVAVRTPLLPARWADGLWLKPENLQPTGAFKIRGAMNKIASLTAAERDRGVITHSSGNHAQAFAHAAGRFGIKAVAVMPDVAPLVKQAATRAEGAEIILVPPAERESRVAALVSAYGYVEVPPYDDPAIIAGQGTVGLEIVDDLPDVDVVLVPVSGGGLISGVAAAVKALRPDARVIGVEPELAADARESLHSGRLVGWTAEATYRTIADGLRVTRLGDRNWMHVQALVDDIVTVSDDEIREAVRLLARRARLVAEPSGAAATAAHLFHGPELPDGRTVAVVSGGNLEPAFLAALLAGDSASNDHAEERTTRGQ